MREIKILIDKEGEATVEVSGVEGSECEALTAQLLAGDTITSTTLKPEYYREASARTVAAKVAK